MTWRHVAWMALLFCAVGAGTASMNAVRARAVPVNDEASSLRQIPYTINTAEIQGAAEILASIGSVNVNSSLSLPVIDSITHYMVLNDHGEPIGYDIYIPGLKGTIEFNATNTVKAAAYDDARLIRWPTLDKLELYKLLNTDSNFGAIVQRVRDAKGLYPNDRKSWNQIRQLTQNVTLKYALERGLIEEIPAIPNGPRYRVREPNK